MADQFDRAQEITDLYLKVALLNRPVYHNVTSRKFCFDCEEPISEKRRQLIAGCLYCVTCAEERGL